MVLLWKFSAYERKANAMGQKSHDPCERVGHKQDLLRVELWDLEYSKHPQKPQTASAQKRNHGGRCGIAHAPDAAAYDVHNAAEEIEPGDTTHTDHARGDDLRSGIVNT